MNTFEDPVLLADPLAGAGRRRHRRRTVNINTADAATIDRVLVSVGPASRCDRRLPQASGAFRSAEQLAMVRASA